MSLDIYLERLQPTTVFSANVTHNLAKMADAAGIYMCLWRPEEIGVTKAEHLIRPLTDGLAYMRENKEEMEALDPLNGWGSYSGFLRWIEELLEACKQYPDATVSASR